MSYELVVCHIYNSKHHKFKTPMLLVVSNKTEVE